MKGVREGGSEGGGTKEGRFRIILNARTSFYAKENQFSFSNSTIYSQNRKGVTRTEPQGDKTSTNGSI